MSSEEEEGGEDFNNNDDGGGGRRGKRKRGGEDDDGGSSKKYRNGVFQGQLELNELLIEDVPRNSNFLIIGKRKSGKSNFIKHLLTHLCHPTDGFGMIAALSKTEDLNHFYRDEIGVKPEFVRSDGDIEFLTRMHCIGKQRTKILEAHHPDEKNNLRNWMLVIVDDLGFDKGFQQCTAMRELMFNNRHALICLVQICQDAIVGASSDSRGCYDVVMCTRSNTQKSHKDLFNHFFGLFPSQSSFRDTMIKYTTNYSVLVADYSSAAAEAPEDQYFWHRAPDMTGQKLELNLDYTAMQWCQSIVSAPSLLNDGSGKKRMQLKQMEQDIERQVRDCIVQNAAIPTADGQRVRPDAKKFVSVSSLVNSERARSQSQSSTSSRKRPRPPMPESEDDDDDRDRPLKPPPFRRYRPMYMAQQQQQAREEHKSPYQSSPSHHGHRQQQQQRYHPYVVQQSRQQQQPRVLFQQPQPNMYSSLFGY